MFNEEPPPLVVPHGALQKPAGAAVDADGLGSCIKCGMRMPSQQMDIVGEGYRCARCSTQAQVAALQGASDVDSHLSGGERSSLTTAANAAILGGISLVIVGIVLLVATDGGIGKYIAGGGVVAIIGALARRPA